MKTLELINKTRDYLDYIEGHLFNIHRAWIELQLKCKDMEFIYDDYLYNWICNEVEIHDFSKLSESEFVQYRKQFYPVKNEPKPDLTEAWNHHKKNNYHHWENWTTQNTLNPYEWKVHCVHMVIDWMAMSYKFGDTAKEYYENNKKKIILPKHAIDFIYEIFQHIEIN